QHCTYRDYPHDGVMTGSPLFSSMEEAFQMYGSLTNHERNRFDPSGCILCVKLSLYEDDEDPYLYKDYFDGMSKNEWSTTYLVLEVGERKTPLKWTVTNCLFKHLQTDDLAADKEINKKEIFILLDEISGGITDTIRNGMAILD
ncbi:MAG: hypothetical protein ACPH6D_02240, partial [Candidatus Puniceispirillales bacterium]